MSEPVHRRGVVIVAGVVAIAVASSVFLTSQCSVERPGPQGRLAPDSNEGQSGAGTASTTRSTPAMNPGRDGAVASTVAGDAGRNAPADPTAAPPDTPTGSLTDGRDVQAAPSAPLRR